VALLLGGFMAFAVRKVVQARRNPVITGWEEMIGAEGEVRDRLDPNGQVFVRGALWKASLADGAGAEDGALERGVRVRVESVEGLTLRVRPVSQAAKENE
jgi:membrane-bound serine protease (ClpP class)